MATSSASLDRSPKSNWVQAAGGLHPYHRKISRAIHEKRGIPLSQAIKFALGKLKDWARGGDNVDAKTQAKAAAAVAHWQRIRGKAKLTETAGLSEEELALVEALRLTDAEIEALAGAGPEVVRDLLEALLDESVLSLELSDEDVGDLSLLEAFDPRQPRGRGGQWIRTLAREVRRSSGPRHGGKVLVHDHSTGEVKMHPRGTKAGPGKVAVDVPRKPMDDAGQAKLEEALGRGSLGGGGKRTTAADMLEKKVNYGGVMTPRGEVIADMREQGHSQVYIDRYLQGLDAGEKARGRNRAGRERTLKEQQRFNSATRRAQEVASSRHLRIQREGARKGDRPAGTTDPEAWDAYIASAPSIVAAQDRMDEAFQAGVDFDAMMKVRTKKKGTS